MARQILPEFQTPASVDALKRRLAAALQGTDKAVQACTSLPDAARASWGLFYANAMTTAQQPTGWFTAASEASLVQELEDELYQRQTQIQNAGCANVPVFNPQPEQAPGMEAFATAAKWLGIGVAAVAGAVIVSKLVGAIPRVRLSPPRATSAHRLT